MVPASGGELVNEVTEPPLLTPKQRLEIEPRVMASPTT
jgi:hypothetical protein